MSAANLSWIELSDIAKLQSGGTPSKDNPQYWGGDIPWISAASMHDSRVGDSEYKLTKAGSQNGTKVVPSDTLLILVRGSMLWNRIPICLTTRDVAFNQDVKAVLTSSKEESNFLFYYLSSIENRLLHQVVGTGIGAGKLESSDLLSLPIPEFGRFEKLKMVELLSTWDKSIEATERLLENSKKRKKALMQQLLTGKKRLPGFAANWELIALSSTGEIVSGGTPETTDESLWGGSIQWLTPSEVTNLKTKYATKTERTITEKGLKNSSANILPKGSLLVCTRATVGTLAISSEPVSTNQGFKNIIPNGNFNVEFLYHLLDFNRKKLVRLSCGSTFLELSKADFCSLKIEMPDLNEQEKIADVLNSSDHEIESLHGVIENLTAEKKALMQQLLTGKKRVKVEEAA